MSDTEFQSLTPTEMTETIFEEVNLHKPPAKHGICYHQALPVSYTLPPLPKSSSSSSTPKRRTSTPKTTTTTTTPTKQTPATTYKPPPPLKLPEFALPLHLHNPLDTYIQNENEELRKKCLKLEERVLDLERRNSLLEGQLMARNMVEANHQKELDRLWDVIKNAK